jgi:acyl-CoA thioesterase I
VLARRNLTFLLGAVALLAIAGAAVACGGSPPPGRVVRATPRHGPLLAVVGASFSAGVGAGHRQEAWPEDLARMLHWRVVVSADRGAGYVDAGDGHGGPFSRLASRLDLARLHPRVIIIQGGHDDIGQPLPLVAHRVASLIARIHREAPQARLAVLSVFARGARPSRAALATDRTIVAAAHHADPAVLVLDPLAGHWRFPRVGDHLHPTAAGHRWIARRLAARLRTWLQTMPSAATPHGLSINP